MSDNDDTAESSTATEAEQEVTPNEAKPEGEASATEQEPKKDGFQKRINQLTREKYEAKQKVGDLEKRVKDLEAKPVQTDTPTPPKEDDFETDAEFHAAQANYIADTAATRAVEALKTETSSRDQETQENERQATLKSKKESFEKNLDSKKDNFKDFDEVAYGHQFMDLEMAEQLFDMDKGPEVAYHLGSNLDEAARIFALSPVQRARELTKLEYQVAELNPKKISDAPDAITPLGNSETVEVDEDNMSADDWQVWRNKQVGLVVET